MNINLTLFGQTITFVVFVWFCMKFVWPPLTRVLDERRKNIADGLAAAERGKRELELAETRRQDMLRETKAQVSDIIALAEKRAAEIVDEAKGQARSEAERILTAARNDIAQEVNRAKEQLRTAVAELAVVGAAKIVEKEIDAKTHARLLDTVIAQL